MAFDAFLKLDGIPGESTDDKHKDWIEILSFSHGMSQPASGTRSSAGGATAARVNIQEFHVTKFIDKASVKITEVCCSGKHIPKVQIELCRAGGDKHLKYMEYKLADVIVSSQNSGGSASGSEDIPVEEISFSFGKIEWTYTQQKPDGTAAGQVAAGWDLAKNTKV